MSELSSSELIRQSNTGADARISQRETGNFSGLTESELCPELQNLTSISSIPILLHDAIESSRDIAIHTNLNAAAVDEVCASIQDKTDDNGKNEGLNNLNSPSEISISRSIDSLPLELVVEVFELAVDGPTDVFRLSGINRRYRSIAISTPCLWNKIDSRYKVEAARLQFERSSHLSISLSIYSDDSDLNPDYDLDCFLEEVVNNCHRILTVVLEGEYAYNSFVDRLLYSKLDQLLSIEFYSRPSSSWLLSNLDMPNLKHYGGLPFSNDIGAHWVQNITSCSLFLDKFPRPPRRFLIKFDFPRCERLELHFTTSDCVLWHGCILPSSKLESLQYLLLDIRCDVAAATATDILLNQIPTEQLQKLEIKLETVVDNMDDLYEALNTITFSNLSSFKVDIVQDGLGFVGAVPIISTAPLLQHMEISGAQEYVLQEYFQMVKSNLHLRTVQFNNCTGYDGNGLLELAEHLANRSKHEFEKLHIYGHSLSPTLLQRLKHILGARVFAWN